MPKKRNSEQLDGALYKGVAGCGNSGSTKRHYCLLTYFQPTRVFAQNASQWCRRLQQAGRLVHTLIVGVEVRHGDFKEAGIVIRNSRAQRHGQS